MSMSAAPPSADSAPPDTVSADKRYLTYKLDLIKTLATKAADAYYVEASGMRVRELRLLRLVHDTPGVAATELRHRLVLDKTLLSKNLADLEKRGLIERGPTRTTTACSACISAPKACACGASASASAAGWRPRCLPTCPRTTGTACTICSTARWPRSTAGAPSTEGVAPNPKSGRAP